MTFDLNQQDLTFLIIALLVIAVALLILVAARLQKAEGLQAAQSQQFQQLQDQLHKVGDAQQQRLADMQSRLEQRFGEVRHGIEKSLGDMSQGVEKRLGEMSQGLEKRLGEMSRQSIEQMAKSNLGMQRTLQERLQEISGQVEKRLDQGFRKTNDTFTDVVKRLALIDQAQKKITELSGNVVSLQEVLTDKRARGAFGEVQMSGLVSNIMPENSYALQHTLSNGRRVDCMLFLPDPTGDIAIDSKFPLDSYQRMMDPDASDTERALAEKQFRLDIRKHIKDISQRYIIPGETADGAIMFIPAEAVFAEIHAHQPELVEEAQRARVWLVSPTTMMAVLTTARAVLKDSATRKQVHLIQEHLVNLSKDFERFRKRMDNLSRHIRQANKDVEEVNTSAKKISSRFDKIEKVELSDEEAVEMLETERLAGEHEDGSQPSEGRPQNVELT